MRWLFLATFFASLLSALEAGPRILFVRGGPGTGGFLEGGDDDQLADITDYSTRGGNHGWGELADWLRDNDFELEQTAEGPANDNTPVLFADMDLTATDVIVLGSNNADYESKHVDAIEAWVKAGGGLLVISDANFGRDWGDAPDSDQQFLDRFGWVMNQDQGTYALQRSANDFLEPRHPILDSVESFDGEGVSPIMVTSDPVPGVLTTIVSRAKGNTRINNRYSQGSSRAVNASEGALVVAEVGEGRVVGHFDRNTFFNRNGAGTDLHRLDNRTYALNLFRWLAFGGGGLEATIDEPIEREITLPASEPTITLKTTVTLFGKKLGIFDPPTYEWSLLEGAGSVDFSNTSRSITSVRFGSPGSYRFQIQAAYRGREASQALEVSVSFASLGGLVEAFGTANPVGLVEWVELDGNPTLQLTYPRSAETTLGFVLEESPDLVDWLPLTISPSSSVVD